MRSQNVTLLREGFLREIVRVKETVRCPNPILQVSVFVLGVVVVLCDWTIHLSTHRVSVIASN